MPDYEPRFFNQPAEQPDLPIRPADDVDFYQALVGLPPGPTAGDTDWIRAHPAMCRRARTAQPVVITAADIQDAPSRAAVNALSFYANNEKDFYRLNSQVERASDHLDEMELEDEAIEVIERMLRDLGEGDDA